MTAVTSSRTPAAGEGTQTETGAFRAWFADSKLVQADGSPMVLYHGTPRQFDTFSLAYFGRNDAGYYGVGHYFTPHAEDAADYGQYVMPVFIKAVNPLYLPSAATLSHPAIYDARDLLAALYDRPEWVTVRTVPEGSQLVEWPADDSRPARYFVGPTPDRYDRADAVHGPIMYSRLSAIIAFHDAINGVSLSDGWLFGLLKDFNRKRLLHVARAKGHDAVVIVDAEFAPGAIVEVVVDRPEQIKSATSNVGTFDASHSSIRFCVDADEPVEVAPKRSRGLQR